ncbi:MAG: DUF1566 domain-containing protein [Methylococcaceae bacterium]|nr:DUF1566 domain-containing protein [Methylococcaceae bacterium]
MQQQLAQLTLEARQQAKREAEEKLQQALDERTSKIEREEKQQRINLSYQEKSKSDKKNENRQTAERYLVKGSLVKDTVTGLMWMRCSLGQNLDSPSCKGKVVKYNWQQALNIAADFSYAGYSDWHLPTIKELNTLVYCSNGKKIHYKEDGYDDIKSEGDWGCDSENSGAYQKPTIKQTIFPNTPSSWFWSSSPNANYNRSSRAWFVSFTYGCDDCGYNSYNYAVRLVRAGQ